MSDDGMTRREIERAIREEVLRVLGTHETGITELSNEDTLTGALGLSSLEVVQIVASLKERLGIDPFVQVFSVTDVRTVGDLRAAYENVLCGGPGGPDDVQALLASAQRAVDRRTRRKVER